LLDLLESITTEAALPAGRTELILVEIDPHRAHAYWNIEPEKMASGRTLVMRVYDVTSTGDPDHPDQSFDVEIQGAQGRWYLDFWRDERTFVADIGYRNSAGGLDVLARSNHVTTPPAQPAGEWITLEHKDPNGNPVCTELPLAAPMPAEERVPEVVAAPIEPVPLSDPKFPLLEWLEQQLEDEVFSPAEAAGESAVAIEEVEENIPREPELFPTAEEIADLVVENRAAIEAYYSAVEALPPPSVSEVQRNADVSIDDHHRETAPEAPPALEEFIGISSHEHKRSDAEIEVNLELHIYGRARPNSEVSLYGQIIKVGPDGTFSIRKKLPDGSQILPPQ
jgi:hypothetical protein